MATYNKRGYKAPKPEKIADDATNDVEDIAYNGESATAEVFDTLDEGANKIEDWVVNNQKIIMGVVASIALLLTLYFVYDRFIVEPKEEEAASKMFQAQKYFNDAVNAPTAQDSLFNLALKGGEGKLGFEGVISEYSGTKTANLAQYYSGMSYLNLKDYKKAVSHLEQFSSDDEMLQPIAFGAIGDCFSELNKVEDALSYYEKAANASENDFTTPRYLFKHAVLALQNNKNDLALKSFMKIKGSYPTAAEASNIDAYIARTE